MVIIREDGQTEFRFYRPDASRVYLCGDFNGWNTEQHEMIRQDDGYWMLRLSLPPGDYRFRYFADGKWYTDFSAFGIEPGQFGPNSIVLVPPPPARKAA
ncbi:MAG: isoamylase early set domain-containing protein [Planctomycetes bacterium]|nr:isoamylase early set domain-containing protein [Planctomycetota bacterium]